MSVTRNLLQDLSILRVSVLDLDNTVVSAGQTLGRLRKHDVFQGSHQIPKDLQHPTEVSPTLGRPTVLLIVSLLTMSIRPVGRSNIRLNA
jgi:hypothetical protein